MALLDRLLAQGVAALVAVGLVQLERLAQDGVRVRASAGAGSYRRRPRLEKLLREAEARVAALKAELESDPAAGSARQRAARERAAREVKPVRVRRQAGFPSPDPRADFLYLSNHLVPQHG